MAWTRFDALALVALPAAPLVYCRALSGGPIAMELNAYYANISDLKGRLEGLRGYL